MNAILSKLISLAMTLVIAVTTGTGFAGTGLKESPVESTSYSVQADEFSQAIAASTVDGEIIPSIIIPGIGQSRTYLVDENGEKVYDEQGTQVTGWPLYFNVKDLLSKLAWPLAKTLITQKDKGFTDYAGEVVKEAVVLNSHYDDGSSKCEIVVEKYYKSLAQCTQDEKNYIYGCIPLQNYSAAVGEENLYYFAYDSFGHNNEIADELDGFIQLVKRETGSDKVNLVPVSLGGTLANAYFTYFPERDDIYKAIFIVPAVDGSYIVSGLMRGELDIDADVLYDSLVPALMGESYQAYLVNIVLRILPTKVTQDLLYKVAQGLADELLSRSVNMWGLVPSAEYEELSEIYLADMQDDYIKTNSYNYYQAQLGFADTIQGLIDKGVKVYNICGYGVPFFPLVKNDSLNSDKIIHSHSTSMGATFSPVGGTLGSGYKAAGTYCSDTEHNHLSPDGQVDATTGVLCDTTWYFANQEHEKIAGNDIVINFATKLLLDDEIVDVYSDVENYPQFNSNRNTKNLRNILLKKAAEIDTSTLSAEDAAELQGAIEQANAMLADKIADNSAAQAAELRLERILVKLGVVESTQPSRPSVVATAIFKLCSDAMNKYFGTRGFFDKRVCS